MYWKIKATIQNAVSALPSSMSYELYYWIQRHFGGLKQFNPTSRLSSGVDTWKTILKLGVDPRGKTFFEVGTGRAPFAPLAYWIMGAKKIISVDLNPYLKDELLEEGLDYFVRNEERVLALFEGLTDMERFNQLVLRKKNGTLSASNLLELCQIEYMAPCDAASTALVDSSVDFHVSYNVFEHIPPMVLHDILKEGNRIVKKDGLFVHRIDYSDHFSHSDESVSAINFLKYSDSEWNRYANNLYMYMNRLRHDDFVQLFKSVGHKILLVDAESDQRSKDQLANKQIIVNKKFSEKTEKVLATTASWIVSQCATV